MKVRPMPKPSRDRSRDVSTCDKHFEQCATFGSDADATVGQTDRRVVTL